jgi:hypothetical protein
MGKSIQTIKAPTHHVGAPAHRLDEFPAGYSLTRCSPAALVSASPAGIDPTVGAGQIRGYRERDNEEDCFEGRNRLETTKHATPGVGE